MPKDIIWNPNAAPFIPANGANSHDAVPLPAENPQESNNPLRPSSIYGPLKQQQLNTNFLKMKRAFEKQYPNKINDSFHQSYAINPSNIEMQQDAAQNDSGVFQADNMGTRIFVWYLSPSAIENTSQQSAVYVLIKEVCARLQFESDEQYIDHFYGHSFNVSLGLPFMAIEPLEHSLQSLTENTKLSVYTQLCILKQMTAGLHVLHDKYKMLCVNIHPNNIYVKTESDGSYTIKYGDFSSVLFLDEEQDKNRLYRSTKICHGSPEALAADYIDKAHDVYCMGRTIQTIATGSPLYVAGSEQWDREETLEHLRDNIHSPDNLVPAFKPNDKQFKSLVENMVIFSDHYRIKTAKISEKVEQCLTNCKSMPSPDEANKFRFK